jgi:hypothetical protein
MTGPGATELTVMPLLRPSYEGMLVIVSEILVIEPRVLTSAAQVQVKLSKAALDAA